MLKDLSEKPMEQVQTVVKFNTCVFIQIKNINNNIHENSKMHIEYLFLIVLSEICTMLLKFECQRDSKALNLAGLQFSEFNIGHLKTKFTVSYVC